MSVSSRVTLQDIADHLNLSRSSVALALRTTKENCPLRPEVWSLVHTAAQNMGYRPNRNAQSLALGKAGCIGIISHGGPGLGLFSGRLVEFIGQEMSKRGQDILIIDASGPETGWMGKLQDGRIDGAMLIWPAPQALLQLKTKTAIPIIAVNIQAPASVIRSVIPDDAGAISLACGHLHALGHRRVAYFADVNNNFAHHSARVRKEAFARECAARNLQATICPQDLTAALALLTNKHPARPSGVVCYNDLNALRLCTACLDAGLKVPRDVSIIGINDDPYAAAMTPALTTVSLEPAALAHAACNALLGEINESRAMTADLTVPVQLVVRASTGPAGL